MNKLLTLVVMFFACVMGLDAQAQVLFESLHQQFNIQSKPFTHGYNRTQIIRKGDTVYALYNVDSPDCEFERGKTTIFKKVGDGAWTFGETFPFDTGGLLVDPQGIVRVFGYWNGYSPCMPNNPAGGISLWTASAAGAIGAGQWAQEWVQSPATVNSVASGRLGGSVDAWGNIYIADGLHNLGVWTWIKAAGWSNWYKQKLMNTPNDMYAYPIVQPFAPFANGFFGAFNVRDDGYDNNIFLYPNGDWSWSQFNVADFRYAQKKVKQIDTYVDTQGRLHLLYQICNNYAQSADCGFDHLVYPISTGPADTQQLQSYASNANPLVNTFGFVRVVEINGRIFYVAGCGSKIYHMEANQGNATGPNYGWSSIDIPPNIKPANKQFEGAYIYVSAPRGGGDLASQYVDILAYDGYFVPESIAFYARIPANMIAP